MLFGVSVAYIDYKKRKRQAQVHDAAESDSSEAPVFLQPVTENECAQLNDSNDSTAGNFSPMATLTIRNLDDAVRDRLRQRAAEHGHSMEEEVRQILRQVVKPADTAASSEGVGSRIHNHFARLGGIELELPSRSDTPQAPSLEP